MDQTLEAPEEAVLLHLACGGEFAQVRSAAGEALGRLLADAARKRQPTPVGIARFTPREWEVLILVAEGRTNDEVAAALAISARHAGNLVSDMLGKADLASRVQLGVAFAHWLDSVV